MTTVLSLDSMPAADHVRPALSIQRTPLSPPFTSFVGAPFNVHPHYRPAIGEIAMQAHAIAAAGIASAADRFEASARRTAADPLADLAGETVERIGAQVALEANAAVLRTADRMAGTLLDILA